MGDADHILVRQARDGSRAAAAQLFERHYDAAWQAAFLLTARRPDADDVTQAAFERAFRALAGFEGRASFGTWLRRIVVNCAIDHLRRERRRGDDTPVADLAVDWEDTAEARDVAAAVRRLPVERRSLVVLHHWLGYSLPEAAEVLGIPLGTAHSRLARAMAELRRDLGVTL